MTLQYYSCYCYIPGRSYYCGDHHVITTYYSLACCRCITSQLLPGMVGFWETSCLFISPIPLLLRQGHPCCRTVQKSCCENYKLNYSPGQHGGMDSNFSSLFDVELSNYFLPPRIAPQKRIKIRVKHWLYQSSLPLLPKRQYSSYKRGEQSITKLSFLEM